MALQLPHLAGVVAHRGARIPARTAARSLLVTPRRMRELEDPAQRRRTEGDRNVAKKYAAGSLAPGPGTQTYRAGDLRARVAEGASLPAVPQAGMSWAKEESWSWIVIVIILGIFFLILSGIDWGGSGTPPGAPSPGYRSSPVSSPKGSGAESQGHGAPHRRLVRDQQHRPRADEP
jgi:hypothetical protein